MSNTPCPLAAFEIAKLAEMQAAFLKINASGGVAIALIKDMLSGVAKNTLVGIMEDGLNMADAMEEHLNNAINSVALADWMFYAIGNLAIEIRGAARRERDLLESIEGLLDALTAAEKKWTDKYVRISKRATRNIALVGKRISLAKDGTTAQQIMRLIRQAELIAKANVELLSATTRGNRKLDTSLAGLYEIAEAAIDSGPIKQESDRVENTLIGGGTARIREELMLVLGSSTLRCVILTRLLYMYAGINYVSAAQAGRRRYRGIVGMINSNARISDIDDAMHQLGRDISALTKKATNEIALHPGRTLVSMSPNYPVSGYGADKELSDAWEHIPYAIAAVSPYSPLPSDTLTVFGASTKLSTAVEMINAIGEKCMAYMASGGKADSDAQKVMDAIESIKVRLSGIELSEDVYKFDDGSGMADARWSAIKLQSDIAAARRALSGDAEREHNIEHYKELITSLPLAKSITEPAMGTAIITRIVVPYMASPYYKSNTAIEAARKMIHDRIIYLKSIMNATSPFAQYEDASCENVMREIRMLDLNGVVDVMKYGHYVTGAVSMSSALAGGAANLFNIFESCILRKESPIEKWAMAQSILGKLKKKKDDTIRKALNVALKPLNLNIALIEDYSEKMRDIEVTRSKISWLEEMFRNAVG